MARGKIITDPVEYLEKKLIKLRKEYNGAYTCATRTHLQDKIEMYEQMLYGAKCQKELNDYRRLNYYSQKKTGKSLAELVEAYK